jgi:hypothetical protein
MRFRHMKNILYESILNGNLKAYNGVDANTIESMHLVVKKDIKTETIVPVQELRKYDWAHDYKTEPDSIFNFDFAEVPDSESHSSVWFMEFFKNGYDAGTSSAIVKTRVSDAMTVLYKWEDGEIKKELEAVIDYQKSWIK